MGVTRFEDLIAWQRARRLTRSVYDATREGEFRRDFGLASQIQRASVSVMSNITEGFERNRSREFHQALSTAKASCAEVRSLLYVALDVGYLDQNGFESLMEQATDSANILGALRASVERRKGKDAETGTVRPIARSPRKAAQ
jgi:four helix bundle protein